MKKLLLIGTLAAAGLFSAQQAKFGITAGMLTGFAKVKAQNVSQTDSSTGFYAGFFSEITINEKFKFVPGLNYANIDDSSALQLPLIVKYYAAPKFNIQAGPQLLFDLSDSGELSQYINRTNIGLALGAGYDISDKFMVEARYSLQLNNTLKNAPSGVSLRANYLNIGLSYKFK